MSKKGEPYLFYVTPHMGWRHYERKLKLGDEHMVNISGKRMLCRVIKVTLKGFNLLDLNTSKCVLRTHLYAKGMAGKEIPTDRKKFTFNIPEWVVIGSKISKETTG